MTIPVVAEGPVVTSKMVDLNTGVTVAGALQVADTFWGRLAGLAGHPPLIAGEGLLLINCSSVHTCFMRYPIDVAYLDRDYWVVAMYRAVTPWQFLRGAEHGAHALELPSGALDKTGVKVGHRLLRKDM